MTVLSVTLFKFNTVYLWHFPAEDDSGSVDNGYCGTPSPENKRKKRKSKCALSYILLKLCEGICCLWRGFQLVYRAENIIERESNTASEASRAFPWGASRQTVSSHSTLRLSLYPRSPRSWHIMHTLDIVAVHFSSLKY